MNQEYNKECKIIHINMGEYYVGPREPLILVASNLGSCIGLTIYDQKNNVGGMSHIVLPYSKQDDVTQTLSKYADTVIPMLIEQLYRLGAKKNKMLCKIAGGAKMFSLYETNNQEFSIGVRNVQAVCSILNKYAIPIIALDVGGNTSRTLRLYLDTGRVTVQLPGDREKVL